MVVLPCWPLPPRTYLHTNRDATPPPATPRCRVGGVAPASGPLAFLPVDHGLGAHNGLHPMEVISPGRANGLPWEGIGRLRGLTSPSALQLPPGRDPLALSSKRQPGHSLGHSPYRNSAGQEPLNRRPH